MNKIQICRSPVADTRTCDWTKVTKEELKEASIQHIGDVYSALTMLAIEIDKIADKHDYTKIENLDQFYSNFQTGFKERNWYEMHQKVERHHLKDPKYRPEDVNLLDVLEMIVDGCMAGLARSGKYRKEDIPDLPELLVKAFNNTIKLVIDNTEVIDKKEECTDENILD